MLTGGQKMARLTAEQRRFLKSQGFSDPQGVALDGTGKTRAQYRKALSSEGKLFVYGIAPCPRGHTLRASGGCPQCNTQYVAFARRARQPGYIYIAKSGRLTKVGLSNDAPNRLYIANLEGYGGVQDWRLRAWVYADRAGKIERAVHRSLAEWLAPSVWIRAGQRTETRELFRCSYGAALAALQGQLTPDEAAHVVERS